MRMMEERWTDAFLDTKRTECDPEADEAVRSLSEREVTLANELMTQLILNEQPAPEQLHPSLRHFLDDTRALPDWTQPSLLAEGQRFFNRCAPQMLIALFCASLPSCYAARKGVKVLHLTGKMGRGRDTRVRDVLASNLLMKLPLSQRLSMRLRAWLSRDVRRGTGLPTNLTRRILETAQMVVDVMAPDLGPGNPAGLAPGGRGIRTAQKVRLMHAAVRHLIAQEGKWDPALGQPINQEDMAATMLAFSVVTLRALPKLGYTPSPLETQAYYHAWRVVGHIMGIQGELLPERYEEGERLFDEIARRQFQWSREGAEMTQALLSLLDHVTPGNLFDDLGEVLIYHLLGASTASAAGVPRKHDLKSTLLMGPLVGLGWVMDEMDEHSLFTEELCVLLGRKLMEGIAWAGRGKNRVPFRLPDHLRQTWGVQGWERAPRSGDTLATA
ncbi:MAG TPA: oxygenase MpaB family protein [Archangium sp.]|uniref:oxygenase MpaB family protein n=1 Tax=Archangium sp. TaxID=1872627 RepID=UPI002E369AA2|nr:oxygenase MpaB family protein [Archangium sp.]HEX5752940.1 oxygenase MpaB family protein [Archangium sp.]